MMARKYNILVQNILLVVLSIFFTLFLVELFLRCVGPSGIIDRFWRRNITRVASGTYFAKFDKQLGWFPIPKLQAERVHPQGDFRCDVKINSKGLRDYEYSYKKPVETYRILLLGDSFTQATQVDIENTVAKQLEKKLAFNQNKKAFQVISGGVGAFGTDQEYLFYKTEGYKYQANLVLLLFYIGNDVRNNSYKLESYYRNGKIYKPFFEVRAGELVKWSGKMNACYGLESFQNPLFQWLQIHSEFFRYLSINPVSLSLLKRIDFQLSRLKPEFKKTSFEVSSITVNPRMPLDYNLFYVPLPRVWEESWIVTEQLILNLHQEVLQHRAKFGVVIVPAAIQVDEDIKARQFQSLLESTRTSFNLAQPDERLYNFLNKQKISYIWLLPQFREGFQKLHRSYYYPNNLHWNAEAHHFAAEILFDWIQKLFL